MQLEFERNLRLAGGTPMYSELLLDHFQNPRNVGSLAGADVEVSLENPACGDVILLGLKMAGERIVEARFKASGCVASIACGSAMTEWILGKTRHEALNMSRRDLIESVGSLPPASTHAAQLALDALSQALRKFKS